MIGNRQVSKLILALYGTILRHSIATSDKKIDDSAIELHIRINTTRPIATVSPRFVSFTLDWWPPDQGCQPHGWGPHANVLEVDLTSPKLVALTKAFGPSILRIGGTLDKVVEYDVPQSSNDNHRGVHCQQHDAHRPCLNMSRWDALHSFARHSNCQIVFGLSYDNATQWNAAPSLALLEYSQVQNYSRQLTLYGVELGEELSHLSVGTPAFANYIEAYHLLGKHLKKLWKNSMQKPKLMGPCPGMDWPNLAHWFRTFLQLTIDALDVAVYHSYNQIASGNLYLNTTIPSGNLSTQHGSNPGGTGWQAVAMSQFVNDINTDRRSPSKPPLQLWLGEFGPHNGGGGPLATTFASCFGFLDTLGHLARWNHQVLNRQTLVGGNYELLRCTTGGDNGCDFEPHPDYWVALLWTRLMGTTVLDEPQILRHTTVQDDNENNNWREALRFHAHCTAGTNHNGSVTVAFSNMSPQQSYHWQIVSDHLHHHFGTTRLEYILQGHRDAKKNSGFSSTQLELNGSVLAVGNSSTLPPLPGKLVHNQQRAVLNIGPATLGFVVFPGAKAKACIDEPTNTW